MLIPVFPFPLQQANYSNCCNLSRVPQKVSAIRPKAAKIEFFRKVNMNSYIVGTMIYLFGRQAVR